MRKCARGNKSTECRYKRYLIKRSSNGETWLDNYYFGLHKSLKEVIKKIDNYIFEGFLPFRNENGFK